jgi:uncharacterized protein (TIGR02594 family)
MGAIAVEKLLPEWYKIAIQEMGQREVQGGENPRILEYHTATTLRAKDDETPWCSAFVNWCMKQAGIQGTNLANARSWLKWGVSLIKPKQGCVVILRRGTPPSGHVCFFDSFAPDGKIVCLGGNQSDKVKFSVYKTADVLGYRWPKEKST